MDIKLVHHQAESLRVDGGSEGEVLDLRESWPDFASIASRKLSKTCSIDGLKRKFPIIEWLLNYHASYLLKDIIAGLSVGLTAIPQGSFKF